MSLIQIQELAALVEKLEALTNDPPVELLGNDSLRRRLRDTARNLSIAVETPGDSMHRIGNSTLQTVMARIGHDTKIFQTLVDANRPLSCEELAEKTKVDLLLIKRLLCYYQSMRMVAEVSENSFAANNVTQALSSPRGEGIVYFTEVLNPTFLALPKYLASHGYKNPVDPCDSPWQAGYNTTEHPFVWLQSHPQHLQLFMMWMAQNREGLPSWLDSFPFAEVIGRNTTDDTVLFVDIGSALGHQSIELKAKYPHLPGRIIIQDLPHVISGANPPPGIEAMVHDFFKPQPVKGARAYYLRMIMHDHPDDQCRQILKNVMSAMTAESVILIDDMVFPETGATWRATQLDMTMMTCLAAMERTVKQWQTLLASVGLKVVKVYKYTEECDDCVIVAKPEEFCLRRRRALL